MRRDTLYNRIFPLVLAMLLVLTMLLPMVPRASAAEHEGSCGRNLSWSYELGVLTITGSGAMTDYHGTENVPWYEFREEIFRVELPEGLTRVGDNAFAGCRNLTAITLPGSVREIGDRAFLECTGLTILSLPQGLAEWWEPRKGSLKQCRFPRLAYRSPEQRQRRLRHRESRKAELKERI